MHNLRSARSAISLSILFLLLALPAMCNTYYIDFAGGSDSNNGLSTSTPWKRHPYMTGWAGSYNHSAGDQFIFKGGVTWDQTCLPIQFSVGGTLSNHDYYGVSSSWYAGSAWSRPIFDAQYARGAIFWMHQTANCVTIDGLDLRGVKATSNFGQSSISIEGCTQLTVTNCWIHKWTHASNVTTDGQFGGFFNTPVGQHAGLTNIIITHCDIGNPDGDGNSGTCLYYPGEVAFCKIHDSPEGILHGGYSVHDNEFYNIVASYDPTQHANVYYMDAWNGYYSVNGPCLFYNNYIHGNVASAEMIYPNGSVPSSGYADFYIYNNVVIAENLKTIDVDAWGGARMRLYIFNNTFVNNSGTQIRVVPRAEVPDTISYYNNHFVGGGAYYAGGTLHTYSGNNLIQTVTQANAAGYTTANFYTPPGSTAPSVGAGANFTSQGWPQLIKDTSRGGYRTPLSRSSSGAWDIGAYQFSGSSGGGGTVNLPPIVSAISLNAADVDLATAGVQVYTGSTVQYAGTASDPNGDPLTWQWLYTINGGPEVVFQSGSGAVTPASFTYAASTAGSTYVWKLRVSDGKLTAEAQATLSIKAPPVVTGLAFEAESGILTAPFVATGGYISQTVQTGVTTGGRAAYNFTITNAGDYVIQALVNAPGDAENSLFVNIDAEPQDPGMVWQVPITTGFQNQLVSWQGSGTFDNPQFVPKVFTLSLGAHQLVIRGREANTQLDRLALVATNVPPPVINTPPVVSAIGQNATDVDPNTAGLQVYPGTTVQYAGSASDPNGDALTWQWLYTLNGGAEVVVQSGSGTVAPISYTYGPTTAGSAYVWKLRVSDGKAATQAQLSVGVVARPVTGTGLTFEAESGVLSAPFAANGTYISQAVQTGVTNGGRAVYSFTLTNAGSYVIQALVNAPGDAANSFYVNIDAEPLDPGMVWQIPITSGFTNQLVSWQGNGTWDNSQFVPKVFTLTQGAHQLIIRGREANVQLDRLTLLATNTAVVSPVVSAITQNAADVDPNVAGLQIFTGTGVEYAGSASDPNGAVLSWQWLYTVNGGAEVVFQSGSGTIPAISFSYGTATSGNTYVWKLRVSNGQATAESITTVTVETPPAPGQGLVFEAESGVLTAPFVVTGTYISQAVQTGVTTGGRAAYTFNITTAGTYVIQMLVNAPGDAANSLYVNIDAEPQDPTMIWQIPITSSFENQIVSWQGTGTWDKPQLVPKVFTLTAGSHQLIIRGREANTQVDRISILNVPQAPQGLKIVATP